MENWLLAPPLEIRDRMITSVESFVYNMLVNVFNAQDTAPLAIAAILTAGSYDLGPKTDRQEDSSEWTESKIIERAGTINQ